MTREVNFAKFLAAVIFGLLMVQPIFALQEEKIFSTMQEKIASATAILQNKSLEKKVKQKDLFDIFDVVFDYELMSKLSLGKQWNSLENDQKKIFSSSFEQKLKSSYIDKLDLYTNEEVVVKSINKSKKNRIELLTNIIGKTDTYEVVYKFYDNKGDWLIYDVDILGVSIIQTYRNQFQGVLQREGFSQLIEKLNKVNAVAVK
ncbi:MAG: ABC transporter substrate-binding protein [Candidatus Marinarcus sp.]|uniref:Tgt2/MlaC family protein n=1 Tax=Candidatus Marinarcus sp. TaxID=3100987 RepID=UPI003B00DBA5